jgi:hypothetical protein
MGLLGYQRWKAEKVESGECRQTIRARRKYPVKIGDALHHYAGLRTSKCRKLRGHLVDRCTETFPISLSFTGRGEPVWLVRGTPAMKPELEDIAKRDGFECVLEMSKWFKVYHIDAKPECNGVFVGDVIRW